MSTEIDEMFEAMTGGLELGLMCEPHDAGHHADRLFQIECACGWEDSIAVCDGLFLNTVARKNDMFISCDSCGTYYKPFDLIKTARQVNP